MDLTIKRWYQNDCVIGRLTYGDFQCFTLELPYKDNAKNISCIPPTTYIGRKHLSQKNGNVISIGNVIGRTGIQIHTGNYTRQIAGCILVGDSVKFLDGDNIPDVTNSRKTLKELLTKLPNEFTIKIY
jgi:hypothetical protein